MHEHEHAQVDTLAHTRDASTQTCIQTNLCSRTRQTHVLVYLEDQIFKHIIINLSKCFAYYKKPLLVF